MLFLRLGDRQELQAYDCEFLVTEGLTVRRVYPITCLKDELQDDDADRPPIDLFSARTPTHNQPTFSNPSSKS